MSFSAEWLALREPIDHAARSETVLNAVADYFAGKSELRITDIGSGTGSTIRALKPILTHKLSWHLIDNDDSLISVARNEARGDDVSFTLADLSKTREPLFKASPDIITTSAFLDLVSKKWLTNMVGEITAHRLPFYAALTYDGEAGCQPELETDATIIDAFNRHQKTDKGFGPALGLEAADTAIKLFEAAGYEVIVGKSDWHGTPNHKAFQKMLLDGWANAAQEIDPHKSDLIKTWLNERLKLIDENNASLFVGHKDFLALPK